MKDTKIISIAVGFSLLFAFLGAVLAYNYLPMDPIVLIQGGDENLGATITTINGSDTIKDSRAVINTNFANLNKDKVEYSTTTMNLLTSIPNLDTVGTITTGTWSGTTLTVAKGGTGSTTLMSNWVLLGNGTTAIKGVPPGSDGNVLTLSSGVPTWGDGTIDQTLDYNWTGSHHFRTGTTTLHGLTKANDLIIASGTIYEYPHASTSIATKGYVDTKVDIYYSGSLASTSKFIANWVDLSLASIVGAKRTLVQLKVENDTTSSGVACARMNGDTEDYAENYTLSATVSVFSGACWAPETDASPAGIIWVMTDTNGLIEIFKDDADWTYFTVLGYIN